MGKKKLKVPSSLEELHEYMNENEILTSFGRISYLISTRCEMAFVIDVAISNFKIVF
jgi:hypothetical protein